jgi:alpha-mannosidase
MKKITFHLLANAHLDPVWLWDWREGLNEGIITVRTILDLMDEDPELTFVRGESAIYQHIQAHDPATFARIAARVREGRWDVVGGTYIQPDTNLPSTETLSRHFTVAQNYFLKTFGRAPRVAWAADSFGHCAGLPEIMARAGITGFAFTRPEPKVVPLEHPAFWWEAAGGARVLAYRPTVGWYGTERDEVFRRFDGQLEENEKSPAQNIGFFWGVGNHGGGPTRRQLADIRRWADKHSDVEVVHSGFHRFFDALAAEEKTRARPYPVHRGELNFCLRGCYVSVAKFKFPYRRTEALLAQAEKTDAIISASLERPAQDLAAAWNSVLFNTFHDILPGSSIERAYEDQLAWLGAAYHDAQRVQFNALNALEARVDTTVAKPEGDRPSRVALLVWNPHPHEYSGPVELEASLDYRPIYDYENKVDEMPVELIGPKGTFPPFQVIHHEHSCMTHVPWRKRVVFQAKLPPMSWSVFQLGYAKKWKTHRVASPAAAAKPGTIRNASYRISARKGASALQIFFKGKPLFQGPGLSIIKVRDPWGSWGGPSDALPATPRRDVQEKWKIKEVELTEKGPERASVWVRFAGKQSRLDLTFSLTRQRPVIDVQARVLWNERSSRLKMVFPVGSEGEFEVPGGVAKRGICGDIPGGRWVRVRRTAGGTFGFASNALYGFKFERGAFHASVVRASYYANGIGAASKEKIWRPAVDAGELNFRFLLTAETGSLPRLASELEQPPVSQTVPAHPGSLPRSGSLFSLKPAHVQLLALKPAENGKGWVMRVQEITGKRTLLTGCWLNHDLEFGMIEPWAIHSFRLIRQDKKWAVTPTSTLEYDIVK